MPAIASESVRLMRLDEARADAPRGSDGVDARLDVGDRRGSVRVRRGSYVDGKLHMAGNDVGRARPGFETPDSRHEIRLATRALLDREHHLGRRGQRVTAQVHRRCARVAGDAVDADLEPRCAVDRGHDAKRQPLRLQARALLDMRLDEGGDALAREGTRAVRDRRRRLSAPRASRRRRRPAGRAHPPDSFQQARASR